MNVIWKHLIDQPTVTFQAPRGTQFVHVGIQGGKVCAWSMHTHGEVLTDDWQISIIGTGMLFMPPKVGDHIGSVVMPVESDGVEYVWHLFARKLP